MEKIYGVYAGNVDISELDNMHEIYVWKIIESLGSKIFWTHHDAADGRITMSEEYDEKLNEMQYVLEYLVYYTRKFGVTFSREPKAGEHVERSEDYLKWFKFWDRIVKSWSDKQCIEFFINKKKEELSFLLPKTNWKGQPVVENDLNI